MSLLNEAKEATGRVRRNVCGTVIAYEQLPEKDRKDFQKALESKNEVSAEALYKVVKDRGVHLSRWAIKNHRNGLCSCR